MAVSAENTLMKVDVLAITSCYLVAPSFMQANIARLAFLEGN